MCGGGTLFDVRSLWVVVFVVIFLFWRREGGRELRFVNTFCLQYGIASYAVCIWRTNVFQLRWKWERLFDKLILCCHVVSCHCISVVYSISRLFDCHSPITYGWSYLMPTYRRNAFILLTATFYCFSDKAILTLPLRQIDVTSIICFSPSIS